VVNGVIGALVYLQLARAYALSADIPKARDAYQKFLLLWKDADSDATLLRLGSSEENRRGVHKQAALGHTAFAFAVNPWI